MFKISYNTLLTSEVEADIRVDERKVMAEELLDGSMHRVQHMKWCVTEPCEDARFGCVTDCRKTCSPDCPACAIQVAAGLPKGRKSIEPLEKR